MKPLNSKWFGPDKIAVIFYNGVACVTGYIIKQISFNSYLVTDGTVHKKVRLATSLDHARLLAGEIPVSSVLPLASIYNLATILATGADGNRVYVARLTNGRFTDVQGRSHLWNGGSNKAEIALGGFQPVSPVETVALDWRMPATVETSIGIASFQTALANAQTSADRKSRPSFTVQAGSTEYVEWSVGASNTYISLSFLGGDSATIKVSVDGVDQNYQPQFPSGHANGAVGKRQGLAFPPGGARVIRLTCSTGATIQTIQPLLHKMPARQRADSHIVNGASREDQGMASADLETAIMQNNPHRDPIVFNWARSGQRAAYVASVGAAAADLYQNITSFALIGSILGNDITSLRPYDETQSSALVAAYDTLGETFTRAGLKIVMSNNSYRTYPGVSLSDQTGGSLEFNDHVTHQMIAKWSPEFYDVSLERARIDEYLAILAARSSLTDDIHGAYPAQRALWARTAFTYMLTGTWDNIESEAETRIAAFETDISQQNDNEASYALVPLIAGAEKTRLAARYNAAHREMTYLSAIRATEQAETSRTLASKAAALLAINVARQAGYEPSVNLLALEQRVSEIYIISSTVIGVNFTSGDQVPNWNNVHRMDANLSAAGAFVVTNLIDDEGEPTGYTLEIVSSSGTLATTNTPGAQGSPAGSPFPDSVLLSSIFSSGSTSRTFRLGGLPSGKKVRIQGISSTTRSSTSTTHYDVPGQTRQTVTANANTTDFAEFSDIMPAQYNSGSDTMWGVNLTVTRGSAYLDVNAIRFVITDI